MRANSLYTHTLCLSAFNHAGAHCPGVATLSLALRLEMQPLFQVDAVHPQQVFKSGCVHCFFLTESFKVWVYSMGSFLLSASCTIRLYQLPAWCTCLVSHTAFWWAPLSVSLRGVSRGCLTLICQHDLRVAAGKNPGSVVCHAGTHSPTEAVGCALTLECCISSEPSR